MKKYAYILEFINNITQYTCYMRPAVMYARRSDSLREEKLHTFERKFLHKINGPKNYQNRNNAK